jgi:quercetin dioxygenase-like cupin family protein
MPFNVRRIVTGHDGNGKAIIASDEVLTGPPPRPGISGRVEIWSADAMPVDNSEGAAAEAQRKGFVVKHNYVGSSGGNVCRVVEFASGGPPFMHRTETLDYAILLKGECDLELDDGKTVHMKAGDICVQRGTIHAWVNNSGQPCTFAFVLIDADPVEAAGHKLTTHYPVA